MSPPTPNQDESPENAAGNASEPMQAKEPPEKSERWLRSSIDNAEGNWEKENPSFHARLLDAIGQTIIALVLARSRLTAPNSATVAYMFRRAVQPGISSSAPKKTRSRMFQ